MYCSWGAGKPNIPRRWSRKHASNILCCSRWSWEDHFLTAEDHTPDLHCKSTVSFLGAVTSCPFPCPCGSGFYQLMHEDCKWIQICLCHLTQKSQTLIVRRQRHESFFGLIQKGAQTHMLQGYIVGKATIAYKALQMTDQLRRRDAWKQKNWG